MYRITPAIARAAGRDAGNRSMQLAGRSAWNEDDYDAASDAYERMARAGGFWVEEFINDPAPIDRLLALQVADRM